MTRRDRGAGNVERTASGRWRFRLRLPDGSRRASPTFATEEECQAVLDAARHELTREAPVLQLPKVETLASFAARWLDERERSGLRSAATSRGLWRHILDHPIAEEPLADLTRGAVQRFVNDLGIKRKLAQRGSKWVPGRDMLSPQTVRLTFAQLRACLNAAEADGLIAKSPCLQIKLPRCAEADGDLLFLAADEIDRLTTCDLIPEPARLHFEMAILVGWRQGEASGLRWEDVELDGPTPRLTIRRSYATPTKNGKVRRVDLFPRAAELFKRWRDLSQPSSPAALVFPSPTGRIRCKGDDHGFADQRRGAAKMTVGYRTIAGLRPELSYHSLRHSCATHLLMGTWGRKWSIEEISRYLGHSSIAVTQRYAHLASSHLASAAAETARPKPPLISGPETGKTAAEKTISPSVTAARFERATYCLGNSSEVRADQGLRGDQAQRSGPSAATAQAILTLAAAGVAIPAELLRALADAVLGDRAIKLALAIGQGGEHVVGQAIELAGLVLSGAPPIATAVDKSAA